MPKEIYKTLMPGEPEPKVKRRVGTAFCLSEDVFKKPLDNVSHLLMFLQTFFVYFMHILNPYVPILNVCEFKCQQ